MPAVVDERRLRRLLDGIEAHTRTLAVFAARERGELLRDEITLSAMKYRFITAIEGCAKAAHHIAAAEGWRVQETNADAVRLLARNGVVSPPLAESIASAIGFRNLLVHQYADIDDVRAAAHLDRLDDLRVYVEEIEAWLRSHA